MHNPGSGGKHHSLLRGVREGCLALVRLWCCALMICMCVCMAGWLEPGCLQNLGALSACSRGDAHSHYCSTGGVALPGCWRDFLQRPRLQLWCGGLIEHAAGSVSVCVCLCLSVRYTNTRCSSVVYTQHPLKQCDPCQGRPRPCRPLPSPGGPSAHDGEQDARLQAQHAALLRPPPHPPTDVAPPHCLAL